MELDRAALLSLERRVARLMRRGRYLEGIEEIRRLSAMSGIPNNELARQVATLAIELGHVNPIRLLPVGEEGTEAP